MPSLSERVWRDFLHRSYEVSTRRAFDHVIAPLLEAGQQLWEDRNSVQIFTGSADRWKRAVEKIPE